MEEKKVDEEEEGEQVVHIFISVKLFCVRGKVEFGLFLIPVIDGAATEQIWWTGSSRQPGFGVKRRKKQQTLNVFIHKGTFSRHFEPTSQRELQLQSLCRFLLLLHPPWKIQSTWSQKAKKLTLH